MTRIISGRLRGKRIQAPRNLPVRPTTDFAKEGLFNVLHHRYEFSECRVLDLFAGTGNLSYELASRGCPEVYSVDNNPHCVKFMEKTAGELNFEALTIIRAEALDFLSRDYQEYDLILADPPYDFKAYDSLVNQVFLRRLLRDEDALLIIEHDERTDLSVLENFQSQRRYGKVNFSFFGYSDNS